MYGEIRGFWCGNAVVDERIILKWIFRMWVVGIWTGSG
jgi:hypothetical protein